MKKHTLIPIIFLFNCIVSPGDIRTHLVDHGYMYPSILRNGDRILFVEQSYGSGKLFTADRSGRDPEMIFEGELILSPEISPTEDKVVFFTPEYGRSRIFTIKTDGTNITQLTFDSVSCSNPCWSPDGDKIVYSSQRKYNIRDIFVMNSDGSGKAKITDEPVSCDYPAWSPDGSKIAYVSDNSSIILINTDGSERKVLLGHSMIHTLKWSPDGSKILFSSFSENSQGDICVVNSDGTEVMKITQGQNLITYLYPSWSPDGTKIIFNSCDRERRFEIFEIDADGSNMKWFEFSGGFSKQ